MNQNLFSNLTNEQYRFLWAKCVELGSYQNHKNKLNVDLSKLKDEFSLLSVHHEFRSPWAISKSRQQDMLEKVFAKNYFDNDLIYLNNDQTLQNFVQKIYDGRDSLLLHFVSDERIAARKLKCELHSCQQPIDAFTATFIVPPFYGHFLGNENMNSFIESVGNVFDCYSHDPVPFLRTFDNSFICCVLRQFFFSPLVRPFVGEQFTVFYDFFSSNKRPPGDVLHYTRYQRFFTLFLKELAAPISVTPPFLRQMFTRITQEYTDKSKIIMTVIIYCIISNMFTDPTAYDVFPLTSTVRLEKQDEIVKMKFYCTSVCEIPRPNSKNIPVQEIEQIDQQLIKNLVNALLAPFAVEEAMPDIRYVTISQGALSFLAKFEEDSEPLSVLVGSSRIPETLLGFAIKPKTTNLDEIDDNDLKLYIELFTSRHPDGFYNLTPRLRAIQLYLKRKSINYDEILQKIENMTSNVKSLLISKQTKIRILQHSIELTRNAISASEAIFANNIVKGIMSEPSLLNELEKKKNQMMNDQTAFHNFITSHLDAFLAKNQWVAPLMRSIARRFHAQVMKSFQLTDFSSAKNQLCLIDQKFIGQKMKVLESLEEKGVDENVAKIVKHKEIFAAAQTTVLRACLFENPLESAKQIVLSLFVVEDLFIFEFGAPPEANQLMPLLANLFILSPVPMPLSFGEWLAHFLQSLMQSKPEWFSDESMRPMEHYFQFMAWMKDMLLSFDNPKP